MRFADIIGNEGIKDDLRGLSDTNNVPHAMIFTGPSGSAKLSLAIAFANYILCTKKGQTDSCGSCLHCIKAHKFIHPDIHFSFPFIGAENTSNQFLEPWREFLFQNPDGSINHWMNNINAENKQANINKSECLSIIKKLSLKPFQSEFKALIMWLPEYLGKEGNRLLKLLEEPPENTIMILVSEEPEKMLNTILSRCQLIKIKRYTDTEIEQMLLKRHNLSAELASQYAYISNGSISAAQDLVGEDKTNYSDMLLEWLRICYQSNSIKLLEWVNNFAKQGREKQKQFFKYSLHFITELFHGILIENYKLKLSTEETGNAEKIIRILDENKIDSMSQLLNECHFHISRNANARILMMAESLKLGRILTGKSMESVVHQI